MGPDPQDMPQDWWGQAEWDAWEERWPEPPEDDDGEG